MAGQLENKVAVVTGGSNGIGRACAERFVAEGAAVVVADLGEDAGRATVSALEEAGGRAMFVPLDVVDAEANEQLIAATVESYGQVDIVVTAAGISHGDYQSGDFEVERKRQAQSQERIAQTPAAPLIDLDLDDWRRVIDVNLTGTLLTLRAAATWMVENERPGSIVTIASIAARDPLWGAPSYPVSKAGVWMLTKNTARTLAPLGVRVNSIGPGFIETNMTEVIVESDVGEAFVIGGTPMGRRGRPEEIANVALFLVSDQSSYVTGELIHPDGGWFTG